MVRQLPNAIEIIPLSMVLGNCLVSLFSRSCCYKKATRSIVSRVAMPRSVASVSALFRRATTTRKKRTGSDSRNTSKLLQPVVTFLPPAQVDTLCCAAGRGAQLAGRRARQASACLDAGRGARVRLASRPRALRRSAGRGSAQATFFRDATQCQVRCGPGADPLVRTSHCFYALFDDPVLFFRASSGAWFVCVLQGVHAWPVPCCVIVRNRSDSTRSRTRNATIHRMHSRARNKTGYVLHCLRHINRAFRTYPRDA